MPATSFAVVSDSEVTAVAPAHAQGAADVVVTGFWGSSDPAGTGNDFAYVPRYEQTDPNIVYAGAWEKFTRTSASGGSYGRSATDGASATISSPAPGWIGSP